jgi:hypothetical protein
MCCRIDIVVNGIKISEDFRLSPAQIIKVWQEKPKAIVLEIELPEHLATDQIKNIESEVSIHGLFINSLDVDYLIENKLLKIESSFRQDIISDAIINHILPLLFPDKNLHLLDYEKNNLKFQCFEKLKPTLEKDGCILSYKSMRNKDSSYLIGKTQCEVPIKITFEAFRKRFDGLFKYYIEKTNN